MPEQPIADGGPDQLAARATAQRASHRSVVVGIFAAQLSTLYVAFALAPPIGNIAFWAYIVAMEIVLIATATLVIAEARIGPSDAELLDRWIPLAGPLAVAFNALVIISPWVMMPLASPTNAAVLYLVYAWFLMITALTQVDPMTRSFGVLIGLPVSLAASLWFNALPLALPIGGFFIVAGLTLCVIEPRRRAARVATFATPAAPDGDGPEQVEASAATTAQASAPPLTPRQVEVLHHVARGLTNKEIARELSISPATVKVHVAQIMTATGVSSRAEAAKAIGAEPGDGIERV